MLRVIINVLFLLLIIRLLRPVLSRVRRYFGTRQSPERVRGEGASGNGTKKEDYSDFTSYEIEDADFEEVHKKTE